MSEDERSKYEIVYGVVKIAINALEFAGRSREYFRKRYETFPEKHEKDKYVSSSIGWQTLRLPNRTLQTPIEQLGQLDTLIQQQLNCNHLRILVLLAQEGVRAVRDSFFGQRGVLNAFQFPKHSSIHKIRRDRYRKYMMQKRMDPEFRRLENDKRKERRQRKRASGSLASSPAAKTVASSRKSSPQKSNGTTRIAIPRTSKRTAAVSQPAVSQLQLKSEKDDEEPLRTELNDLTTEETDTNYDDDDHDQDLIYASDCEILPESSAAQVQDKQQEHIVTVSIEQSSAPPPPAPVPEQPPCSCSQSAALAKLATISRELSVFDRRRFESYLLQSAEDFM